MSLLEKLTSFASDLFKLTQRVDENAEEIAELRRDLKTLADFSRKVAGAVTRNQDKAEDFKERVEDKHQNLVLSLKVELLELERRLYNPTIVANQPGLGEENGSRRAIEAAKPNPTP